MSRLTCVAALAFACSSPGARAPQPAPPPTAPSPGPAPGSPDQAFEAFGQRFLEAYFQRDPVAATGAGEHRFDATWPDVSAAGDASYHRFLDDTRAELAQLVRQQLSRQNQVDAAIIDDQLRSELFQLDELKARDSNPLAYVGLIADGLDPLVTREFGTLESRMTSLAGRLEGIPAIVAAAKQRLQHPSKIHTETAIQQNTGLISLIEKELPPKFAELPALRDKLAAAASRAAGALHDLQTFLERDLLARSDGSFRIGRERFAKKLGFALGEDVDVDAIAANARAVMEQTRAEMVETAKQIWAADKLGALPPLDTPARRNAFVKRVLDRVALERPTNKTILADAKRWLDGATAFVREHDLVRVPDEPVAIIEMPEYKRGIAVAYCDSSGPLEAVPQTFYAISPTPADWPKARVESFYREYNAAMLAELSVHEAMPGHYLQAMHNNKFPSKLRAVFSSGPFVEGWAVYGEWLMAKNGFGGARVNLQRQKMLLRVCANAILDHDIHTGTMDERAALALMKDEAFQEDGEAVGKWKRARLSSAQLTTYFYGFTELLKIRELAAAKPGFTERAFHDRLLSFGSPAIKYVRQLVQQ